MLEWISANSMLFAWIIIAVIAGIAEACTAAVVSIWVVCGAIVAGTVAFLGGPVWLQLVLCIGVTAGTFITVRKSIVGRNAAKAKALMADQDSDHLVNKRGVVSQTIPVLGTGQVCVDGVYWTANSLNDDEVIEEGTRVVVVKVDGNCLLVCKYDL